MKLSLYLLSYALVLVVVGQDQTLKDKRDGQTYAIRTINQLWWMLDNLNLETDKSKSKADSKREVDPRLKGRWYHQEELNGLCPKGWRLPAAQDWFDYLNLVMAEASAHYKLKQYPADLNISRFDKKLSLFAEGNPLGLISTGIFEGEDYRHPMGEQADYWIQDLPSIEDENLRSFKPMKKVTSGTSHIHLHDPGTQIHSHKHHLDPAYPNTMRRFMVRCVCEELPNGTDLEKPNN